MESCRWISAGIRSAAPSMHNHPCYWGSMWVWLIPGLNFFPPRSSFPFFTHLFYCVPVQNVPGGKDLLKLLDDRLSTTFSDHSLLPCFSWLQYFCQAGKSIHSAIFCSGILLQVISSAESVLLGRRDGGIIPLPTKQGEWCWTVLIMYLWATQLLV